MAETNNPTGSEPLIPMQGQSEPAPEGITQGQDVQGQAQTPVTDDFNPQTWELNYRGQKIYPKDRSHLMTLANQGFGAAQQIEALNKQRNEIEAMKGQYSHYDKLDQAFKQHPQFAQKIQQMLLEYQTNPNGFADTGSDDSMDPRVMQALSPVQQKLQELEQWRSQQLQSDADRQVQSEIQALKTKYNDQDWETPGEYGTLQQRILQHAVSKGLTDLELAYKDYMFDSVSVNSRAAALKEAQAKQQQQHRQGVVQSGTGAKPASQGKVGYNPGDSYQDITQKAKQMLGA